MSPKKAKELPRIMSLGTKPPPTRANEIPHWKVWRWAWKHPGLPWSRA